MKELFSKKNNNGITLVALVITIIILLILSGITISQLVGNGLFENAKIAREKSEYSSAYEKLNLKIMEANMNNIKEKGEMCNLRELEAYLGNDEETEINVISYNKVAYRENNIGDIPSELKNIEVKVVEYKKYTFIIGETCKIEKYSIDGNEYIEIESSETKEENETPKGEYVDVSILTDISKFTETIQEKEKLEYIINNPEIFMHKILENLELSTILFKNEKAMDLIINSTIWRNKILESDNDITGENSNIIKALDASEPINLPTTNLELYDPETKTGNVVYSSYLRNEEKHSPTNAFIGGRAGYSDWQSEYDGLPSYIGYDFGEGNKVWLYKVYVKPGNNTAPTKMYLQSSNDNITWENIYEFIQYPSANNYATEVINSEKNNKKSRYWRLYITESSGINYVDLLKIQFYGK